MKVNYKYKNYNLAFVVFMLLILVLPITFNISIVPLSFSNLLFVIIFHQYWIYEWLALLILTVLSISSARIPYNLFKLFFSATLFFLLVQLVSLYQSQTYLSSLALENISYIRFFLTSKNVVFIVLGLCFIFLGVYLYGKSSMGKVPIRNKMIYIFFIFIIWGGLYWLISCYPNIQKEQRDHISARMGPICGILYAVNHFLTPIPEKNIKKTIATKQQKFAAKLGLNISLSNKRYPLLHEEFYNGKSPFRVPLSFNRKLQNVIVFFGEGLSSRILGGNSKDYFDISPNIDDFASDPNSMIIDNYYNHTGATFRGLQGTFCSMYPIYGGMASWNKILHNLHLRCLPNIFGKHGYETIFLSSQTSEYTTLDEMMNKLGFSSVLTAEELSYKFLDNEPLVRSNYMSDHQLMRSMMRLLQNRFVEKPFFLALYNTGTHAWQKIHRDGKHYRNGENSVLDVYHSYDDAFGLFWSWFKTSKYFKNTIIILTADHARHPDDEYMKAITDPTFKPYPVDRIPFIIYDAKRVHPKHYDANYATSIAFAPTLLHYLGFESEENHFIGTSLFDKRVKNEKYGLNNAGDTTFLIDKKGVHNISSFKTRVVKNTTELLNFLKQIELENRIYNGK